MRGIAVILLVVGTLAPAWAHWETQSDLPPWAQRGRLHWCLHYSTATRELVDLFTGHHQTLVHGGSLDSEQTARHAAERGLRYMPYVCSRTTTTQEIAQTPQLAGAVVLNVEGEEVLAYNNPVRRYGSLHTDAWPEWVRERTRRVWDRPDVSAIFYDNAFWPLPDYHVQAIDAWQRWARDHGLDPAPGGPPTEGQLAAPARAFVAETLTRYHMGLHEFCHGHEPPLLNAPNLGSGSGFGLAAVEAGAIDLVFYETASHPPFDRNGFRYKVGLAASHGRPTGMLMYVPATVGEARGVKTWHEGMHHFFYPSSPLPEEFALAAAEGAACGGTYIPCYNLFPALPITDTSDPFNRRIHRELQRSYDFIAALDDLYAAAQPGADVAILYSAATDLQNRLLQNAQALSLALTDAGIPFEVLVSEDLATGSVGPTRTLIVPGAAYLSADAADGILRFARAGGRVIVTGEYAVYDEIGRPAQPPSARELLEPLHLVSRPIREWELTGFEPEGPSHVRAVEETATALLVHEGAAGRYVAHIQIGDESDGTSAVELSVAGRTVFEGLLDREDNSLRWLTTPPFEVSPGESVILIAHPDGGEPCRTHAVVLAGADASGGAAIGQGEVLYSPTGLETLEADRLVELLQPAARLPEPGEVFASIMDVPGMGLHTVHLVNYDFRYEVRHDGLWASDDGSAEARMFFGGGPVVVRKTVALPEPEQVVQPVVEVYAFATAAAQARMVVSLNGQEVGEIEADSIRSTTWAQVPVPPDALTTQNTIQIRAEGELDGMERWLQISIDTDTNEGNSAFSTDGGATFSSDDLSTDRAAQTGEYMIRIRDLAPGEIDHDPANLLRNPGFEQTNVPHSETTLTVVPARDVVVELPGETAPQCLAISPDAEPEWLEATAEGGTVRLTVPRVDIYTMLLLADVRAALEPIRQRIADVAPWAIPPVTEPLRPATRVWQAFGSGFALSEEARSGEYAIVCTNADAQGIAGAYQELSFADDPPARLTLTGWSRCEDVSGPADAHYSIWVDATCVDGTAFNGHNARFEVGTHDWQQATLVLEPPAPLSSARIYCIFRMHTGRAWFDDLRLVRE
ncbi:MAG: hypothetical protein AB7Y46_01100 [Armatimonadota bacterium]